jgi:glutaredoxin 3
MKKVTVYSTPTCPYCIKAKNFFKKNNIEYEDIDVSKDQEKAKEMVEKSGQMGVPTIDIEGKIIMGFDEGAIKEALGL